jgi:hypothetical protein
MKESNTMISDWLDKYGCPEIYKQVEREVEKINLIESLKTRIKNYCKDHKLKFEKYIKGGFIASKLIPKKAGMKYDIHARNIISFPIREIGKKRVYRKFICFSDGDIVDDGEYNY